MVIPTQTVTAVETTPRPNIIYILADDLGYGDLGCYGQKTLATPNLDRMATEGMRFTQHYAGSTVCAPSRCVLLTGLHTGHCRVRGNGPGQLLDEDVTIAEVLKKAGYRTGCVGKWGIGNPPPLDDPQRQGFDYFYGYVNMFHAHNFYPEFIIRNGEPVPLRNEVEPQWKDGDGRGIATKRVDYVPDLVTAEALSFIERNRDEPFFLYFAMNVPHTNNEATRNSRPERGMEVPSFGEFAEKDWPGPEKGFASMIRNLDGDVGKVLAKLKELNLDENTLVIFSSDNGPHQEGGHQMPFFDSNGQLQGMKRDLYEGGIRVPMIARWPEHIQPASESSHVSGFQDMLPTLAQLAGVDAPATDGLSLVATLLGEGEQVQHDYMYWEFLEKGGRQAVLQGKWKGIRLDTDKNPNGPIELYDISEDIEEANNIADQYPDIVAKIAAIMRDAHVSQ
ncbi:MAG: arylsulfatase [Planctomycetaceae bacterium]|nr:arylsulfatase [Planctomycetaceae bacterium]MCB9941177.1 arylsulfatase [Planctomycetaceae bacterium]